VNGETTILDGGCSADYATLRPYGSGLSGDIKLNLPKYSTAFFCISFLFCHLKKHSILLFTDLLAVIHC